MQAARRASDLPCVPCWGQAGGLQRLAVCVSGDRDRL